MLNPSYYKELLKKYVGDSNNDFSLLVLSMIIENYRNLNIHFNFPNNDKIFSKIINQLYNELAFFIFDKYADFPPLKIGDRLRKKGGTKKDIFRITKFVNNCFTLSRETDKSFEVSGIKYDKCLQNYVPIIQNTQEKNIKRYEDYFKPKNTHGFLPTNFSKKVVFVGKSIWDRAENINKIPTIYFPNTKEDNDHLPKKSITALTDCIIYIAPKYNVCYEQVLQKGIEIDTIVLCGTEDSIQQILQDQNIYKFKIILLTNNHTPTIPNLQCWNWYKEEIDLIQTL